MIKEAETFDIIDGNVIDKPSNKEARPIHGVGFISMCYCVHNHYGCGYETDLRG